MSTPGGEPSALFMRAQPGCGRRRECCFQLLLHAAYARSARHRHPPVSAANKAHRQCRGSQLEVLRCSLAGALTVRRLYRQRSLNRTGGKLVFSRPITAPSCASHFHFLSTQQIGAAPSNNVRMRRGSLAFVFGLSQRRAVRTQYTQARHAACSARIGYPSETWTRGSEYVCGDGSFPLAAPSKHEANNSRLKVTSPIAISPSRAKRLSRRTSALVDYLGAYQVLAAPLWDLQCLVSVHLDSVSPPPAKKIPSKSYSTISCILSSSRAVSCAAHVVRLRVVRLLSSPLFTRSVRVTRQALLPQKT